MPKKFTDSQFATAVAANTTVKDVLAELGLAPTGGNYGTVYRHVERLGLDTSHWDPKGKRIQALKTSIAERKLPIDEILVENGTYTRSKLKRRLISERILDYECAICGISSWLGEDLSLHLDHINGVRNDDRLENLRFLCPNCHSLTPTYCGRANKKPDNRCIDCHQQITKHSTRCVSCASKGRYKIDWPPINVLMKMLSRHSYLAVARSLGVSDNAIRKHIKRCT